jgi:transketolase
MYAFRRTRQHHGSQGVLVLQHAASQLIPTGRRAEYAPASGVARGAYVLADAPGGKPEVILIASGSEVCLVCADTSMPTSTARAAR